MSTSNSSPFDLAIIGGGASGTILLLHLLNQIRHPFRVVVLQKGHAAAKGVAYSTTDPRHLLNVRAGRMSAYADQPDHFVEWLRTQTEYPEALGPDKEKEAFVPRYLYGRYLEETLRLALHHKPTAFEVTWISEFAVSVHPQQPYTIHTDAQRILQAEHICIATGIEAPAGLPGINHLPADERIHINPWLEKLPEINNEKDILVIGTGLTMVDHVISLLNADFKGRIIALSKHGHLPMAHPAIKPTVKPDPTLRLPGDLSTLFNVIKKRIQEHPDPQGCEEPVLEDIRPYSQDLWFNFSKEEKHRFLRHLQHHWAKLRHRIPHPIYLQLKEACAQGKLILHGGKATDILLNEHEIQVSIQTRKHETFHYQVQRIFNCVGPVLSIEKSGNPFIRSLAENGMIRNSASGLGPDANMEGQVIQPDGTINENIFVLGPLMRGVVWEAVAVPEIRNGANIISKKLLQNPRQQIEVA